MHTAHCGNLTISYEDSGAGEPALLLLPGWCASRAAFDELAVRLAKGHRVLSMDWRGHGGSSAAEGDFGSEELVADALAVIAASGAKHIVPVATAHAGWVAIELRRRLGSRIAKLVLVDWIVGDPPPPFLGALAAMQIPNRALEVRDGLFGMWTQGVEHPGVLRYVRQDMGSYPATMWSRAGREIAGAYAREGSPLRALAAQESFAAEHPWFAVRRLDARSHFPTIEVPDQMQEPIERFVAQADSISE